MKCDVCGLVKKDLILHKVGECACEFNRHVPLQVEGNRVVSVGAVKPMPIECTGCADLRTRKDGAYTERNKCVALIAKMATALGLKVGLAQHDPNDKSWDEEWRTIIFIDLPSGQVSWHFHDSHKWLLEGLPIYEGIWDGHSTDVKYERVLAPGDFYGSHKLRKRDKRGAL